MRKIPTLLATAALTTVAVAAPMSASAAQPFLHQATGGVYFISEGNPQFMDFSAFDYGDSVKGAVHYTNFGVAEAGSGVWGLTPAAMTVTVTDTAPTPSVLATHTWTITSVVPTSVDAFAFTATGTGGASPEVVTGTVDGTTVSFSSRYVGGSLPGYTWTSSTGAVSTGNGSMAGTATDSLGYTYGWYTNAGAARGVYSYSAKVTSAVFSGAGVVFGYTVPLTEAFHPGLPITISATDGQWGDGQAADTLGVAAPGYLFGPAPILGGQVVVHK